MTQRSGEKENKSLSVDKMSSKPVPECWYYRPVVLLFAAAMIGATVNANTRCFELCFIYR